MLMNVPICKLSTQNPLSQMVIFIRDQVLQTGEALTSFVGTLLFWILTRGKYVWKGAHK